MNIIKKTTAFVFALLLTAGAPAFVPDGFSISDSSITAEATSCISFDNETGTLTLKGNVDAEEVKLYWGGKHGIVKTITAEKGTVLPADCNYLFAGFSDVLYIDLSNADTSNVTNMSCMFYRCEKAVTIKMDGWDTSKVTNMGCMFDKCKSLTALDLSGFNTKNVTTMSSMFNECGLKTVDLSSFNTSKVTDMAYMFSGSSVESLDLSSFDTSNVTYMMTMFSMCSNLKTLDVSSFNTSNVVNMSNMFNKCSSLEKLDLHNFDTSNVSVFINMFNGCTSLTDLDVSSFDISNADSLVYMFAYCKNLTSLDLRSFKKTKATSADSMFMECDNLTSVDLRNLDTSNIKTMDAMFYKCVNLTTVRADNWELDNATEIWEMFQGCEKLKTIYVKDSWNLKNCDAHNMFLYCTSIVGGNGTRYRDSYDYNHGDYARIDGDGGPGYFTNINKLDVKFSHNVSLGNNLSIVYYVPAAGLEEYTDIKLSLIKEYFDANGNKTYKQTTIKAGTPTDNSYGLEYEFRFNGIAAKEMGSNVTAVLSAKKNDKIFTSTADVYSIKQYAMNKLTKSDTQGKLKTLLVDMLNYGAQAQQYFKYNTGDLVNKNLTAQQKAYASNFNNINVPNYEKVQTLSGAKAKFTGKNLNLGNSIALVYFMEFSSGVDTSKVNLHLTYNNVHGESQTVNIPYSKFTKGDYANELRCDFTGIAAKDSMQAVTAVIQENNKNISDTLTYSIPTYTSKKLASSSSSASLKEILKSMMVYYTSAKNYFA